MSSTDKFCLRWNDFETNISSAFREIREDKDLFDCTLSCGSDQVQAHKLVLSACSPFFKSVFKQNPHQHPLLYLKDIRFDHLTCVLNFMYHGEVNIAQDDLNSFLAVAEDLKIKGLTQNSSEDRSSKSTKDIKQAPPLIPKPPPMTKARPAPAPAPVSRIEDDDDIQEVVPVKSELGPGVVGGGEVQQYDQQDQQQVDMVYDEGYDYGDYEEGTAGYDDGIVDTSGQDKDQLIQQMIAKTETGTVCLSCNKQFSQYGNARAHVEAKHIESSGVACHLCGFVSKTRDSLRKHIKYRHNS